MKKLSKDEVLGLFYKLGFFKSFTPEEKYQLADFESHTFTVEPSQFIVEEGDQDRNLYILLKGSAYVTKSLNPRTSLAQLKPGSVFGEVSLLADHPRITNVRAADRCLVMKMDATFIKNLGPEFEIKIKDQLIRVLVNKLERMNQALLKVRKRVPEDEWKLLFDPDV
ncbi:MAG: hypothetical protein COV67_08410 [Nitrospinae bacterium CG11_big_fil_rev_8_21_14_0_20_56_8]|nr:MAG: hypothetical protein COV67_08410 [Nitrospinae bacterium CG11_big_fil_rev_8_21_14_0_20_56_8]